VVSSVIVLHIWVAILDLTKLPFCIQQKQMHSLSFASGTHVKWELLEQWCQSIIFSKILGDSSNKFMNNNTSDISI